MKLPIDIDDTGMVHVLPKNFKVFPFLVMDYLSFQVTDELNDKIVRYDNGFVYTLEDGVKIIGIDGLIYNKKFKKAINSDERVELLLAWGDQPPPCNLVLFKKYAEQ